METQTLSEKWQNLKETNPKLRIRNAADELGVSEAELLATQIDQNVTRLKPEINSILKEIESLGKVMALTRNDSCVHERKGVYLNPSLNSSHVGLFVGDDIDLRMFLSHWKHVFAVENNGRKSLQFFGEDGLALHKIFLIKGSDEGAYADLVKKYQSHEQEKSLTVKQVDKKKDETPLEKIDTDSFKKDWENLKDTHHFFGLINKYKLSRLQALKAAPSKFYASEIENSKIVTLLEQAADTKLPIMVFVGNRGNIQIHTGKIRKTLWYGDWFNVMDPGFNLHLNMNDVDSTWLVRKPTDDGIVTAIEVFDKNGQIIVQFFGKRKPGIPELKEWQALTAGLES